MSGFGKRPRPYLFRISTFPMDWLLLIGLWLFWLPLWLWVPVPLWLPFPLFTD